jgi:hypothetical protein
MSRSLSPISKKIRRSGFTLRYWAKKHGFNYQTTCHITAGTGGNIYGPAGLGESGRIVQQLKKDGFWVEPAQKKGEACHGRKKPGSD